MTITTTICLLTWLHLPGAEEGVLVVVTHTLMTITVMKITTIIMDMTIITTAVAMMTHIMVMKTSKDLREAEELEEESGEPTVKPEVVGSLLLVVA